MTQSRAEADRLMEQQHYPVYDEDDEEEDDGYEDEDLCFYCGEPLEDGVCSASCPESAEDEGREDDPDEEG